MPPEAKLVQARHMNNDQPVTPLAPSPHPLMKDPFRPAKLAATLNATYFILAPIVLIGFIVIMLARAASDSENRAFDIFLLSIPVVFSLFFIIASTILYLVSFRRFAIMGINLPSVMIYGFTVNLFGNALLPVALLTGAFNLIFILGLSIICGIIACVIRVKLSRLSW